MVCISFELQDRFGIVVEASLDVVEVVSPIRETVVDKVLPIC